MGLIKWLKGLNDRCDEAVLHDQLLVGEVKVAKLDSKQLLSLYKFTRYYQPSFDVYEMVGMEMEKRRNG